jgi:hypothetical protein
VSAAPKAVMVGCGFGASGRSRPMFVSSCRTRWYLQVCSSRSYSAQCCRKTCIHRYTHTLTDNSSWILALGSLLSVQHQQAAQLPLTHH